MSTTSPNQIQNQALEAIHADVAGWWWLYHNAQRHPKANLLFLGMVPLASMFVVESYQSLVKMLPQVQSVLSEQHANLLRASRHRAKLLDDSTRSIDEVAKELVDIARAQRQQFQQPHTGPLAPLKRRVQPDLGLFRCEGHVFSTTHTTMYGFGSGVDAAKAAFSFGEAIGAYLMTLVELLQPQGASPFGPSALSEDIDMRDIRYEALYQRGIFGGMQVDYAASLVLLLSSVNFAHYVLRGLLPPDSLTFYSMRFLTAFHANSGLLTVQSQVMAKGCPSQAVRDFFSGALGNADSKWLHKQDQLRNLLAHYLAEGPRATGLSPAATRVDAINHFSRGLDYDQIDALLDRYIEHLSSTLEDAFDLSGDPFWYGRVT